MYVLLLGRNSTWNEIILNFPCSNSLQNSFNHSWLSRSENSFCNLKRQIQYFKWTEEQQTSLCNRSEIVGILKIHLNFYRERQLQLGLRVNKMILICIVKWDCNWMKMKSVSFCLFVSVIWNYYSRRTHTASWLLCRHWIRIIWIYFITVCVSSTRVREQKNKLL